MGANQSYVQAVPQPVEHGLAVFAPPGHSPHTYCAKQPVQLHVRELLGSFTGALNCCDRVLVQLAQNGKAARCVPDKSSCISGNNLHAIAQEYQRWMFHALLKVSRCPICTQRVHNEESTFGTTAIEKGTVCAVQCFFVSRLYLSSIAWCAYSAGFRAHVVMC